MDMRRAYARLPTLPELPVDRVQRSAFHVALDPAEVLADQREDEPLHAEDEDDADSAEERTGEVRAGRPVDDAVRAEDRRDERAHDPERDADPLHRLRPEPREQVEREPDEAERRIR